MTCDQLRCCEGENLNQQNEADPPATRTGTCYFCVSQCVADQCSFQLTQLQHYANQTKRAALYEAPLSTELLEVPSQIHNCKLY